MAGGLYSGVDPDSLGGVVRYVHERTGRRTTFERTPKPSASVYSAIVRDGAVLAQPKVNE